MFGYIIWVGILFTIAWFWLRTALERLNLEYSHRNEWINKVYYVLKYLQFLKIQESLVKYPSQKIIDQFDWADKNQNTLYNAITYPKNHEYYLFNWKKINPIVDRKSYNYVNEWYEKGKIDDFYIEDVDDLLNSYNYYVKVLKDTQTTKDIPQFINKILKGRASEEEKSYANNALSL